MDGSELNRQEYESKRAVDVYAVLKNDVLPEEQVIFARVAHEMPDARVLEIGIGTGRTIPALRALFPAYVGIDYSHAMLKAAQQAHPDADLRWADARDLAGMEDESFDFVFFAWSGIDSLTHADRLRVLSEVHRVLRGGGLFGFCTHNLEWRDLNPVRIEPLRWSIMHPLTNRYDVKRFAKELVSFRKLKHLESRGDGYAIVNDSMHYYSLLLYHITRAKQLSQLRDVGFDEDIVCFDKEGHEMAPVDEADRTCNWLHYLARKPHAIRHLAH